MKRLLLPVMVPVMAIAALLIVVGVTAAGAHQARASKAATIQLKTVGKLGKVLVNGHGQTLYLFQKDKHGKSSCYGQCAKFWPPTFTTGKPIAGSGVSAKKLGTTKRKDGKLEVTYNGHPLYSFVSDRKPGQATGQGVDQFGGPWWVLAPSGTEIHHG
jgi:predicted lipoprotein with Yx(FWY)xxD motif